MSGDAGVPVAASSTLERTRARIMRHVEPAIAGFHDHEWTGKLFLITGALGLAGTLLAVCITVLFWPLFIVRQGFGSVLLWSGGVVVAGAFLYVHWKVLDGVARFRRWARLLAMAYCGFGAVTGLAFLGAGIGLRGFVLAAAEVGLSIQFFLYFLRNGERYE